MGDQALVVFTTAEIVLGECENAVFTREFDAQTGYPELMIRPKPAA
jgi:uncharacterized protein